MNVSAILVSKVKELTVLNIRKTVLILLALVGAVAVAQDLPQPVGYVNDFASVISATDEIAIEEVVVALQRQTGAVIAVVSVESMSPFSSIEQYGIALAEKWQVGPSDTDEGILLIVALQERQVRIEVGYGLEDAIPDGRAGSILDTYVIPSLRNNDYGTGLLDGVIAIAQVIAEKHGVTLEVASDGSAVSGAIDLWQLVGTGTPLDLQIAIDEGANVGVRDENGRTLLFDAVGGTNDPLKVAILLKAGVNVNARDRAGFTALYWAVYGDPIVISILIDAGAEIDGTAKSGWTPLMEAAAFGWAPEVITVLLEAGADGKLENDAGNTAFELAANNPHLEGTDVYWELSDSTY